VDGIHFFDIQKKPGKNVNHQAAPKNSTLWFLLPMNLYNCIPAAGEPTQISFGPVTDGGGTGLQTKGLKWTPPLVPLHTLTKGKEFKGVTS